MHYFSGKGCSEFLEIMHYCIGILKYFIMNQKQVLTKEMIMEYLWGIDSGSIDINTISVIVSRLKKKLGDESKLINNVFGMGYRMGE